MHRILGVVVSFALVLAAGVPLRSAADKPTFTVGWSIYAGWTPYYYMQKSGILRKWADKYGTSRSRCSGSTTRRRSTRSWRENIDACTMTNMEALDMPRRRACRPRWC
jgi:NitT/TauT family transport system substrate-binding protein